MDEDILTLLAPWLGPVDADALAEVAARATWVALQRGDAAVRQGEPADAWYILHSGRLRVEVVTDGRARAVRHLHRGDGFGEIGLLDGQPRSASLVAERESLLLRFDRDAFDLLAAQFPQFLRAIATALARSLDGVPRPSSRVTLPIALVAVSADVDLGAVSAGLAAELARLGAVLHLSQNRLAARGLLPDTDDPAAWRRLRAWVDRASRDHDFVLFEVPAVADAWAARALAWVDRVFHVTTAASWTTTSAVAVRPLEHDLRRTLVILHDDRPGPLSGFGGALESHDVADLLHLRPSDHGRWARLIARRPVALALGGGGAKGFAHLGVVRALREARVPIDAIGGVSMGAIMGAQLAMGIDLDTILALNRRLVGSRPFSDFNFPYTAALASRRIDAAARQMFGDLHLEDLWVPFFCIAADLTTADLQVFDRGPVWEATRGSGSLPGLLLPFVWRNHLLVDGGAANNLPADLVRERFGGTVIAVDACPEGAFEYPDGQLPTGWTALWRRLNPFAAAGPAIPTMADVLVRTMMFSSYGRTRDVERHAQVVARPPIGEFHTLDFERMDEIVDRGYRYAIEHLAEWDLPTG